MFSPTKLRTFAFYRLIPRYRVFWSNCSITIEYCTIIIVDTTTGVVDGSAPNIGNGAAIIVIDGVGVIDGAAGVVYISAGFVVDGTIGVVEGAVVIDVAHGVVESTAIINGAADIEEIPGVHDFAAAVADAAAGSIEDCGAGFIIDDATSVFDFTGFVADRGTVFVIDGAFFLVVDSTAGIVDDAPAVILTSNGAAFHVVDGAVFHVVDGTANCVIDDVGVVDGAGVIDFMSVVDVTACDCASVVVFDDFVFDGTAVVIDGAFVVDHVAINDAAAVVFDVPTSIVFERAQIIGDNACVFVGGFAGKRDLAGICDSAIPIFDLAVYVIYFPACVVFDAAAATPLVIILDDAASIIDFTAVFVGDDASGIVLDFPAHFIINLPAIHVIDGTGVVDGIGIIYGAAITDGANAVDSTLVVDGASVFNLTIGLIVNVTARVVGDGTLVFDGDSLTISSAVFDGT